MRSKFLQIVWRDVAPLVALVLALVVTFWTRHSDSADYPHIQPTSYYQGQL
jgi:hypothetical protein